MSITLKADIQDTVGPIQLCASYEEGCEAAVHELFSQSHCDAIIQVDATNAFNSLNRQVALRNVLHLCSKDPHKQLQIGCQSTHR